MVNTKIRLIIFFADKDGEALYSQQKQDQDLTVTLIMNSFPRSELNSLSCVQLSATTWAVAHQAPQSMGFSRQEYWSGLPFPSPGYLPNPGIKPRPPTLQADTLTSETPGMPLITQFRLKLKKVGKTTRPFRYDLNKIPYDYTGEVRNRFKGLDLLDRVPDEL